MTSSVRTKKRTTRSQGAESTIDAEQLNAIVRQKPLVFISHDSRDAALAEAFANLLADVSGGTLKSFRSSDKKAVSGIEFGTEWYNAVMSRLNDATDVVALLTQHSLDRPWILYEAGVAKGRLGTNVLGIALGVPLEKVSTGPFGQFQNCDDDENSLTTLVTQLLQRNPDASPREEAIRRQVSAFLKNTESLRAPQGAAEEAEPTDESNVARLFEEVKAMVRELPVRIDGRVQSLSRKNGARRYKRLSPAMLDNLSYYPGFEKKRYGPAAAWLLAISILRDDLPWLYEAGMEFYRTLRNGSRRSIEQGRHEIMEIIDVATHSPFLDIYDEPDMEPLHYFISRLPELVHRLSEKAMLNAAAHRVTFISERSEMTSKPEKG